MDFMCEEKGGGKGGQRTGDTHTHTHKHKKREKIKL